MSAVSELKRIQGLLDSGQGLPEAGNWFYQKKLDAGIRVLLVSEEDFQQSGDWYFVGDLHGDFFALHSYVEFVKEQSPDFSLVFLGDLIDRGPHSAECVVYVLELAKSHPGRITWVAGNHDVGLRRAQGGEFNSSVSPSEFADELNDYMNQGVPKVRLGTILIEMANALPRALILPNGLFVTHGGMPHSDLQRQGSGTLSASERMVWLNSPACLQDITWTRISRFPKKLPNRESTGCSYGFQDFKTFAGLFSDQFQINALLTGHEHPVEGFDKHVNWVEIPALTLTGFGFDNDYLSPLAYSDKYRDALYIGKSGEASIPDVISIVVDRTALKDYFLNANSPRFLPANLG